MCIPQDLSMKKTLILYALIIIFFICKPICLSAQDIPDSVIKIEDSLLHKFSISKNNSIKVDELYLLSSNIYIHDFQRGMKYIDQSIQLADRINYDYGKVWGHYLKGIILYYYSNYNESQKEFFLSLELNKTLKSDEIFGSCFNYLGMIYGEIKELEKAELYYKKSLHYYEKSKDTSGIAHINNNIGYLLLNEGEYDEATKYLEKAVRFYKDSAFIANTYLNLIKIDLKKKAYEKAYDKLSLVQPFSDSIDDFLTVAEFYYLFGSFYEETKDFDPAKHYYNKCIDISKEKNILNYLKLSLKALSNIYYKQENYKKSLEFYTNYSKIKDSSITTQNKKQINQLELTYAYNKKLTQLKQQQQKNRMKYAIMALSFFIFCLILAGAYYLQRKRIRSKIKTHLEIRQNLKKKLQNSSLARSKLEDELQTKERELDFKHNQLVNSAIEIIKNHDHLKSISSRIKKIVSKLKKEEDIQLIKELDSFVKQTINLEKSRKNFYTQTRQLHKTFLFDLESKFSNLSSKDKELALMLKLGYSSKEISILSNISPSSVNMARYRLRKKLNISSDKKLKQFFNSSSDS